MVQRVEELEQDTHQRVFDQTKEVTMSSDKGGIIWNFRNQLSKLSRDLYEADANIISAHRFHDLQNRTKMNPLDL